MFQIVQFTCQKLWSKRKVHRPSIQLLLPKESKTSFDLFQADKENVLMDASDNPEDRLIVTS